MTPDEDKAIRDAELLALASQAIDPSTGQPIPPQPGAGTGETLGLDLSAFPVNAPVTPRPPAPNGVPVEGPVEVPGDRTLPLPPPVGAPAIAGQQIPASAPPSVGGAVDALDTARGAANDVATAQAATGPIKAEESRLNADAQSQVADQARQNAADIQAEQQAISDGRQKAQQIADSAAQEYKNFKYSDWWGDKSDGERLRANIFVALGAFAAGGSGNGHNAALEKINTIIDQNHRREVAENKQLYDFSRLKAEGVEQFMANSRQDMANLQLKNAARYQATADEAKAQLIRNGVPADEAENDVLVAKLRAKGEEDYAKGYSQIVSDQAKLAMNEAHFRAQNAIARGQLGVARQNANTNAKRVEEKPPTESEGNNAARGRNMSLALDNLEKSGLANYVPPESSMQKWFSNQEQIEAAAERNKSLAGQAANFAMRKTGSIPQTELEGLPEKDRQYFSLMRQVVEPYARKQSGAAIARTEWQNFAGQTGLGTGEFGKNLREQAARDMLTLGGRATAKLETADRDRGAESVGSASINKSSKSPTVVETQIIDGVKWHKLSNGKFTKEGK